MKYSSINKYYKRTTL